MARSLLPALTAGRRGPSRWLAASGAPLQRPTGALTLQRRCSGGGALQREQHHSGQRETCDHYERRVAAYRANTDRGEEKEAHRWREKEEGKDTEEKKRQNWKHSDGENSERREEIRTRSKKREGVEKGKIYVRSLIQC